MLQDGTVNSEHDNQRGRYVDRHAENALERDEQMADQPRDVIAAMRPWRRQVRPEIGIKNEANRNHRHDPASGATRGLQDQVNEDSAKNYVPFFRHSPSILEIVT